jgi:hypothetical protein
MSLSAYATQENYIASMGPNVLFSLKVLKRDGVSVSKKIFLPCHSEYLTKKNLNKRKPGCFSHMTRKD